MTARIFHNGAPKAPILFVLDGERVDPTIDYANPPEEWQPETWTEEFTAMGQAPPGTLVSLLGTVRIDHLQRPAYQVPAMLTFVSEVLIPTDRDRWWALVNDQLRIVKSEVLGELTEWLSEEVFGRPLVRRPASPTSPSSTPGSSTPESPPPDDTSQT